MPSVSAGPSLGGKPLEVEGVLDLYFYTPLGRLMMLVLRPTGVSPNAVSWLSVAAAGAAAVCYFQQRLDAALAGTVLFLLSGVLDSADGQLARATGRTSELGETLDGLCDSLSFGLVYLAGAFGWVLHAGGSAWLVLPLMVAAIVSHSAQSAMVDFERQLFSFYAAGRERVLREDAKVLEQDVQRAIARGEGWWPVQLRRMRLSYCRGQRRWLASSDALLHAYRSAGLSLAEKREFALRYRAENRVILQAWTVAAPNSHSVGVMAAALLPYIAPGPLTAPGLGLVFLYDLALNAPTLILMLLQRRADHRVMSDLKAVSPH